MAFWRTRRALAALAAVLAASVAGGAAPEQLHLAFAGRSAAGYPTGMRVAWYTSEAAASIVQYRPAGSGQSWSQSNGTSTNYLEDHGYHHVVLVTNLTAGGSYEYRCGDGTTFSGIWQFTVPKDGNDEYFSMVVYGDMGYLGSAERPELLPYDGVVKNWTAMPSRRTIEALRQTNFSLVWHLGDIAYADDAFTHHPLSFSYEDAYNGFMNWFQNVSAQVPYMVSPGNHESECHSLICLTEHEKYAEKLQNFTAFEHRWHMPAAEAQARETNMWYSFNLGPVHFLSINSETDWPGSAEETHGDSGKLPAGGFGEPGEYLAWLERDLAQAATERAVRPFMIAGGHRPFEELVGSHGALFAKYGVDMYLAGHSHAYLRRQTPRNGTTYIVVGGAGCDEMAYAANISRFAVPEPAPTFGLTDLPPAVFQTDLYAIGLLQVLNRTAVRFQLINAWDQSVLDEVTVVKS